VIALFGWADHGLPSSSQLSYSFLVALFSGVIATLLFFSATNLVHTNPSQLAMVEATQAGELLFTLIGEMIFLCPFFGQLSICSYEAKFINT
jgi:hypothetical protein